jgi:hypothetical protein
VVSSGYESRTLLGDTGGLYVWRRYGRCGSLTPLSYRIYIRHLGPLLCSLVLASSTACRSQGGAASLESAPVEAFRFPHDKHAQINCVSCHGSQGDADTATVRPGGDNHKSCAQSGCHVAEFRGTTSELCALCHEDIGTGPKGSSPLVPFPPQAGTRAQAVAFSHQVHLDADVMEQRLGFHLSCVDCHQSQSSSLQTLSLEAPSHAACARCHAAESAPVNTPSMATCQGCHKESAIAPSRERKLIQGDLRFTHRRHRTDRKGRLISCATCHLESTTATQAQVGQHAAPPIRVCVACHDDTQRVAGDQTMRRCETCHVTRTSGLGSIAPRSHLPETERPADHTRAFRRDHAADANADSEACARCHTMLSGNKRDTCDECHQVMRPSDHVVTWREYDHGPEAATDPGRCSTCHQADFCVACHQTRPRSHFPLLTFRLGGHGTQAVLNMRACVTCHNQDRDCTGSGCHQSAVQ